MLTTTKYGQSQSFTHLKARRFLLRLLGNTVYVSMRMYSESENWSTGLFTTYMHSYNFFKNQNDLIIKHLIVYIIVFNDRKNIF